MNDSPLGRTMLLVLSIVIAAWLVGRGLTQFRLADRAVSVKGVAEREVI